MNKCLFDKKEASDVDDEAVELILELDPGAVVVPRKVDVLAELPKRFHEPLLVGRVGLRFDKQMHQLLISFLEKKGF